MKFLKNYKLFESAEEAKSLMINPTTNMRDNYNKIIKAIDTVNAAFGFSTGKELLKEISMVETRLGTVYGSVRTTGTAGRGPWQIDEIAFNDIKARGSKEFKGFFNKFMTATGIDLSQVQWNDCNTFLIGCAFARLVMQERNIKSNFDTRLERADIWKKHYNTVAGKGTPEKYWDTVQQCLKALSIKDNETNKTYAMAIKERDSLLASPDTENQQQYTVDNKARIDSTYVDKKPILKL